MFPWKGIAYALCVDGTWGIIVFFDQESEPIVVHGGFISLQEAMACSLTNDFREQVMELHEREDEEMGTMLDENITEFIRGLDL